LGTLPGISARVLVGSARRGPNDVVMEEEDGYLSGRMGVTLGAVRDALGG